MTVPIGNIDNTTLLALTGNLDIGDVADPLLRLTYFQYLNVYIQTITTAFNAFVMNGAVGSVNLADLAVLTAKIAELAVTTGKIADLAVTTAKLGAMSVTLAKMAAESVGTTQLINLSVTDDKIANSSLTAVKFAPGVLTNETANGIAILALQEDVAQHKNGIRGSLVDRLNAGEVTKIKLIGDSIFLGSSATGAGEDPAGRAIGTTGFKEGLMTSPCFANHFRNYITAFDPTIDFFNAGIGGWSATSEGVTYRDTWIGTDNDVILMEIGTNDRGDAATEEIFYTAFENLGLAAAATCNTLIMLTAPPTLNDYYEDGTVNPTLLLTMEQIDRVITRVCIANGWEHISFYREFLDYNIKSNTSLELLLQSSNNPATLPGSHPIDAGHLLMWKIFQQKMGFITNTWDWKTNLLPNQNSGFDSANMAASVIDLTDHDLDNLWSHGDFDASTGWTAGNGTLAVANGVATVTGSGANALVTLEHSALTTPLGEDKLVYLYCELMPDFAHVTVHVRVAISAVSGSTVEIGNYGMQEVGMYSKFSGRFTTTSHYALGLPYMYTYVEYSSAGVASGKTFKFKNVFMINLTDEFGAGNEPSAEAMDALIESYGGYISNGTAKKNILAYVDQKDKIDAMWINETETLTNLVDEGNFPSIVDWSAVNATHAIASGVLTNTADGTASLGRDYNYCDFNQIIGTAHKMYYSAEFMPTNAVHTGVSLRMIAYNGSVVATVSPFFETMTQNVWTRKSGIAETTALFASPATFGTYIQHSYVDAATANGKELKVKNVVWLDLTSIFGAGNEPTAEIMDLVVGSLNAGFIAS